MANVGNFNYPPAVYVHSLEEERRGYVNRRAAIDDAKSPEAKRLDQRIADVDAAIALQQAREAGDAPADAPAE